MLVLEDPGVSVVSCPRVLSDGAAQASLVSLRGHMMIWRVDGVLL